MGAICFYFQVHQPSRIKKYRVFDIGRDHVYFDDSSSDNTNNKEVFLKVSKKCYLPTNELILRLLQKYKGSKLLTHFPEFFWSKPSTIPPKFLILLGSCLIPGGKAFCRKLITTLFLF